MYFPRTKTCQVQSKDLNLGHLTNASTIYPLSVCCLAFILSVVFTTFSSVYFNYILYWRTLKVSKIYQVVRDWMKAVVIPRHLFIWNRWRTEISVLSLFPFSYKSHHSGSSLEFPVEDSVGNRPKIPPGAMIPIQ